MAAKTIQLTPLALETRTALPTPEAAGHLNRAQQTIRPIRINGRLAWPVSELRRVLGVA